MSLTVRYYPDASADFEAAVERYGSVSTEILERFLAEVDAAIDGIMLWPDAAPTEPSWTEQPPIRRARVKGSPRAAPSFPLRSWVARHEVVVTEEQIALAERSLAELCRGDDAARAVLVGDALTTAAKALDWNIVRH